MFTLCVTQHKICYTKNKRSMWSYESNALLFNVRMPISNDKYLDSFMSDTEYDDVKSPLYGEQKTDRSRSKNSSPNTSGGMVSPLLNNLNSKVLS